MKREEERFWRRKVASAVNVQPVKASGTIYIRADGSIDPQTAPIQKDVVRALSEPPETEWNRTYSGCAYSAQQTIDGGYIMAGVGFPLDFWLAKTDGQGNLLWNKTYDRCDDEAYSVQQTSDGGYIMAGLTCNDVPTAAWLVKTDAYGNVMWNKTYGGNDDSFALSIQQTSDGGYIATGLCATGGAWFVKTDGYGNMEWNKKFGGSWAELKSVQQTTDGGYIVAGGTMSFGAGDSDFWLVKTDDNGNMLWNKTYGGTWTDIAYSVQQTSDGGYMIAGFTDGGVCAWLIKLAASYYTLTISTTVGGTTNPAPGVHAYEVGSSAQVTAIPSTNYVLDHWELDGASVGNPNPINITMDKNHVLHAVFVGWWWPMFHHDLRHTGYSPSKAPNTNSTTWSYTTGGAVSSSLAVADGKLYVGSADNKVYCLNASTGAFIWSYTTGGRVTSPAVADGRVYVGSADGKVYAFGPYDATINAHCNFEGLDVSVTITMDGSPTGYTTPHTFTNLTGTHTFTVPNTDPNGHPFKQWNTGETSTTITVNDGGTYTAYYDVMYTLTITTTTGGTTNPAPGAYTYWSGAIVSVTAIPDTYYSLDHWELDGVNVSSTNPYSVLMDTDHTLHAVFLIHDVAVTNVTSSKTVVGQGYSLNINVTVENQGDYTETFNVTVYANTTIIETKTNITLTSGNSTTLTFTWNTTGVAKGNYTITVEATHLPGETDTTDNTLSDGWIIVAMIGDLTGPEGVPEGKCDMRDVYVVARAFGSTQVINFGTQTQT